VTRPTCDVAKHRRGFTAKVRDEVSEAALAHMDRNAVRAAYLRAQYLDERAELSDRWEKFILK
jgi:hypothetical protein